MQTFVPLAGYKACAVALDHYRLKNQRKGGVKILAALDNPDTLGWATQPATVMWRGYIDSLVEYLWCICDECDARNIRDFEDVRSVIADYSSLPYNDISRCHTPKPWWWGSPIHKSHRESLIYRDPEWYEPLFKDIRHKKNYQGVYVWPFHNDEYEHLEIRRLKGRGPRDPERAGCILTRFLKPRVIVGTHTQWHGHSMIETKHRGKIVKYLLQRKTVE